MRADIYSLGVILFEMLTGEHPFTGPLVEAQVADLARYAPTPREINPAVNRDLEAICEKCLQKSPERRFETATALADDLERFLKGEPIVTRPITGRERVQRFLWFHRVAVGFSAALLVSVLIGSGVGVRQYFENRRIAQDREASLLEQQRLAEEAKRQAAQRQAAEEDAKQKGLAIAVEKEKVAKEQERADQEQQAREIAKRNNQLHDYASDMQTIQRSWQEGNRDQVVELLVRHDPSKNGGVSDIRGFEWYYWQHLLSENSGVIENGETARCLAVDESGHYLAVSDFKSVTLWNLDSRSQVWRKPLTGSRPSLFSDDRSRPADRSVAFSRDGKRVAGVGFVVEKKGRLGTLKVWDRDTGKEVLSIVDDRSISGRTVVFDLNAERVVGGGFENGWKCWNLARKEIELESEGDRERQPNQTKKPSPLGLTPWTIVQNLGFSEDGTRLFASCMAKNPGLSWKWPFTSRNRPAAEGSIQPENNGLLEWGGRLPAGLVRATSDGRFRVVHLDGALLHLLSPAQPGRFKSTGRTLGANQGEIRDQVLSPPEGVTCYDMRGFRLVAGGSDQLVYQWRILEDSGKPMPEATLRGHGGTITAVTLTPQGRPISAENGGSIRLWNEDQPEIVRLDTLAAAMTARELPREQCVEFYSPARKVQFRIPLEKGEHFFQSKLTAKGRYLVVSIQGGIQPARHRLMVWDLTENRSAWAESYGPGLLSADNIAVSGDEKVIAAVMGKRRARLWSLASGKEIAKVPTPERATIALNHDGSLLAVGGDRFLHREGDSIEIWDVPKAERTCQITPAVGAGKRGTAFLFSSDGDKLIVDGTPSTLWNARTGNQLPATLGDILADAAETSQDGRRLYFMSGDTVRVCCAKTFRPLLTFKIKVKGGAAVAVDDRQGVSGSGGFWSSESLDRQLAELVGSWQRQPTR